MTTSEPESAGPPETLSRPPRHDSLMNRPIAFAHRGARAHAPENTVDAFRLAKRLGATGLESDVFITADGIPVLDHDGLVGTRPRRKPIRNLNRDELPTHILTLAELYEEVGVDLALSLDVKDPAALTRVVEVARTAGAEANLWLCYPDVDTMIPWRHTTSAKLVHSVRLNKISEGVELRCAKLASVGIDALNMRTSDWNAGQVSVAHRFGLYAFGWDAQQHREIATLFDMGIDAVYSDHVDRLTETLALFY